MTDTSQVLERLTQLEREQRFLFLVQMSSLGHVVNAAAHDPDAEDQARYSETAMFNVGCDALRAAQRIPHDMDVSEAADKFTRFAHQGGALQDWFAEPASRKRPPMIRMSA